MSLLLGNPMLILLLGLFSCVEKPDNPLDIDDDGDGYSEFDGDCDDSNPNAYPGAAELDSTELCMVDNDGDGYGDDSVEDFSGNEGYRGTDCDDFDDDIFPVHRRCAMAKMTTVMARLMKASLDSGMRISMRMGMGIRIRSVPTVHFQKAMLPTMKIVMTVTA